VPRFPLSGRGRGAHRSVAGSGHSSIRSHAAVPSSRLRRRLRLLPIIGAVPLLFSGVAMAAMPHGGKGATTVNGVTVTSLTLRPSAPSQGQAVSADAVVVSDRRQRFDSVVVAVRDQAGHNVDFPATSGWTVGSAPKVLTATRTFTAAGDYTYWFAYSKGGVWTAVGPKKTFTVTSGATAPSSSPSPSPLPSTAGPSPAPTPSAPGSSSPTVAPTRSPSSSPSPTATPTTGSPSPVGVGGSWRYTFGDDFTGPIAWGTKWSETSSAEADGGHGNKGNQQLEWNQAANCSTTDGVLSLTAKPANITSPSGTHYDWSSCLLSSSPSYAFQYGYIEVRAQLPGVKGFWPAFWTWQAAGNNQWTETDVFEFYSDNHSRLYLTQHSGAGGGTVYGPSFDPTTGFHTYGADIQPNGTRYYVDGNLVFTAPGTSTGMTNIILDNFVYAGIPPVAGTTGTMQVDYVRAWQH
jgi:hypothetical protein